MIVTFKQKIITMKHIFMLFLFSFSLLSAHKPKVRVETFGNVKTYFSSGFNFGEKTIESEELKMQIIGKLSKVISGKLRYSDTVLIERRTYNAHNPNQKLFILENNNSQYKIPVLDDGVVLKSNNNGLSIRIVSDKIEITDILKLVEYSILNREKLNNKLISIDYYFSEKSKLSVLANTEDLIQEIIKKESKLIEQIINDEIVLLDNGSLRNEISWNNNEFIFSINTKKLKDDNVYKNHYVNYRVSDFRYYIDSFDSSYFIIFNNTNTFTYFDGVNENTSPKINIEKKNGYAFKLIREKLGDKIILYDTPDYFYVYNIKKKLLQKIE